MSRKVVIGNLFLQLEENIHELLQRVEPKDAPTAVHTPATPPDVSVPAGTPSSAPEPSAPLPAPSEGEDGLPQLPPSAEAVEGEQQHPVQKKEQMQQQLPHSVEKSADEPVEDRIPGKHASS